MLVLILGVDFNALLALVLLTTLAFEVGVGVGVESAALLVEEVELGVSTRRGFP